MAIDQILSYIDTEIAKLQEAKRLLSDAPDVLSELPKRGRPKGSKKAGPVESAKPKRTMAAEGRAKIAEAQRKRHAAKKGGAKKATAKKVVKKSAKRAAKKTATAETA